MTASQAKFVEYSIIGLCVIALAMIFQPFAIALYSIGAGLVVLGGLAFNLIPFCRPGIPFSRLIKVSLIVLLILAVVVMLGIGTAYLYVWYLGSLRG
jgi:lipoprotein signal peptidase